MATKGVLDAAQLLRLFDEVDRELTSEVSILIGGGASLALLWGSRGTYDVDVVSDDMTPELRAAVARVGTRAGISEDWLNDGAKGFAPYLPAGPELVFDGSNLRVFSANARYLLAMKLMAARGEDGEDIQVLMEKARMFAVEDLLELVEHAYPNSEIPVTVQYLAEDVVWQYHQQHGRDDRGPDLSLGR